MMFRIFTPYPNLVAAISEKKDGNCRGFSNPNRAPFLSSLGIAPEKTVTADLVHGISVQRATEADAGKIVENTDALIACGRVGLFLSVTVADCLPIFIYDPAVNAFGIAHAGWRGLADGIVVKTVRALAAQCGADPARILAGIGPGIGPCHFEVKPDVAEKFSDYPGAIAARNGAFFADLPLIARAQLAREGVKEENTEVSGICTFDAADKYFSRRRDKPAASDEKEAMIAVIGLLP